MQIHAVKSEPTFNISAAMASPDFRSVAHIVRDSGLEARISNGGPIPVAELDAALRVKHIGLTDRMALKSALGRVGLLK